MTNHSANTQGGNETTVTVASKALKVGERGIYHAKLVLAEGTDRDRAIIRNVELNAQVEAERAKRDRPPSP